MTDRAPAAPADAEADLTNVQRPRRRSLPFYPEGNVFIFLFFLLFVVARYMQWGARQEILAKVRFEFVVGLALSLICLVLLLSRPPVLKSSRRLLIAISLLFAMMVIQIPFAADKLTAREIFTDRVVKFAFLTFFMTVLITSPRYLRCFLYAFLLSCLYITQESVRGLISGGLVWENQGVMRLHGAVPIYEHPNSLGGLAMGTIPFVVFLFPHLRSWVVRIGLLVLLGTSTICVITSGSRTAYVAFFAFLFYWWFFSRYKLRWLAVALIVGAVGLAVVPDQYKARFESITGEETESHSKAARLQILEDAWHIFLQNPLGVGVASFPAVRYKTYGREQDTHNLYLEVATNLGVQGLAAFFFLIWVMMTSYRTAYRRFRAMRRRLRPYLTAAAVSAGEWRQLSRHARDLEFMMAVCVAAAGFIFVRLVLGLFGMDLYEVYWWFGAGMVICLMNLSLSAQTNTERLLQGYGPA